MKTVLTFLFLSGLCVTLSGCVSSFSKQTDDGLRKTPDYSLIAENLVHALGSIDSISRINTTFQMLQPTTPIGDAVFNAVKNQGYGIQIVTGDLGNNFLRYKAELSQTESGLQEVYSLAVGDHSVSRQYTVDNGATVPISPVTIQTNGVVESPLDDSLFGLFLENSVSSVIEINTKVPDVVVYKEDNDSADGSQEPLLLLKNVYSIQESNFKSIFANYDTVSQQTLIFSNDSLSLGLNNKIKLSNLAVEINPETDIVSVIGCSHGRSSYENGNQLLAEGRAQRVTESLMFSGVDPNLIFDEACWASNYWDEEAPRRGVMVTHKRLKNSG